MIHHLLPRFCAVHVPITREVMVGFRASWKVTGLVSGLALISSDWLVEMKRILDFLVCSLMAICTWAASPPTMNWHFWFSISSLVRWAPTAGLSSSSRKRTSTLRPITPPLALSSSWASWAPRCMSAASAAKGPVRGSGQPMRIGSPCARSTAGKNPWAARAPAVAPVVVRNVRRVIDVIVILLDGVLLEIEGSRLEAAQDLADRLEAAVVGGRHHRARHGVTMPALEGQIFEDPATARQPDRALRHHGRGLRREVLGLVHGEHGRGAVAAIAHAGRFVEEQARRPDGGGELGDGSLGYRVMTERLRGGPDGLGSYELHDVVEGGLADAQIGRGVAEGEAGEVDGEEARGRADDLALLHESVVADGVTHRTPHAHGVPRTLDLDAGIAAADEGGEKPVLGGGGALADARDEVVIGGVAQGAELLHPTDLVAAWHGLEDRLEHELVAEARLGLAGHGGDELALVDHFAEVAASLLLAAKRGDKGEHGRVHVEGERGGRAALGHLEQAERVGEGIGPASPIGARNGETEQIGGAEVGVVLGGEARLYVVARRPRREPVAGQRASRLDEGQRLGAERGLGQHPMLPRPFHEQLSASMGKVMADASARIVDNRRPPALSRQRVPPCERSRSRRSARS